MISRKREVAMTSQAVEVVLDDFLEWETDEGYAFPYHDLPDELEFDNAKPCQCGAPLGWGLGPDDPETGAPMGSSCSTWRLPDGRYVCEDCAMDFNGVA